ncbi:nitroreductase family protein [Bifidobacterium sp. ESL0790]|uniref:nitroreductase family protein n=1 Tax=Bifidobacterium sp. ESL0790 TaxID=2983233 RepID=UPI0023F98D3A|nr:nitroreductase family protein [Bifidobacterium sp. ESL0790]WEV72402.1 hypothetical protein OZY47_08310 [Bifidobacterium sp. ESL0790]
MNLNEAMTERHSVRMYTDEAVSPEVLDTLASEIKACNDTSGLHIQMASGLDDAFCGYKTHYGHFTGVHNAIALVAHVDKPYDLRPKKKKTPEPCDIKPSARTSNGDDTDALRSSSKNDNSNRDDTAPIAQTTSLPVPQSNAPAPADPVPADEAETEEKVGYYGEQLALRIVQLGLATSWAVLDDAEDGWWQLEPGERLVWILAFGHPARAGAKHHSKPLESLCSLPASLGPNATLEDAPNWFQRGIAAASLAPTSLSQQPFVFELENTNDRTAQDANTADGSRTLADGESSNNSAISSDATGSTSPTSSTDSASPTDPTSAISTTGSTRTTTSLTHSTRATTSTTDSAHAATSSATGSTKPLPTVIVRATPGLFAHVGVGCAKRNFEIGAGSGNFQWSK